MPDHPTNATAINITTADIGRTFHDRFGDVWTIKAPTHAHLYPWVAKRQRDGTLETFTNHGKRWANLAYSAVDLVERIETPLRITSNDVGRWVKKANGTIGQIERVSANINNADNYCIVRWDDNTHHKLCHDLDGTHLTGTDCSIVAFTAPPTPPQTPPPLQWRFVNHEPTEPGEMQLVCSLDGASEKMNVVIKYFNTSKYLINMNAKGACYLSRNAGPDDDSLGNPPFLDHVGRLKIRES